MAKVKIYLRPNGEIEMEVLEVKGSACLKVTEKIEESLGEVIGREATSDYYSVGKSQTGRKQSQRHYEKA